MLPNCGFCCKDIFKCLSAQVAELDIEIGSEVVPLKEVLEDLIGINLSVDGNALICQECFKSFSSFYKFKRSTCKNLMLSPKIQHKLVKTASDFLDKASEKIVAMEHHNCLSFVPISKVNLMKTFIAFTPTVTIAINDGIAASIEQCDDISIDVKQESSDDDISVETIPKKTVRRKKLHGKGHPRKSSSAKRVDKKAQKSQNRETLPESKGAQNFDITLTESFKSFISPADSVPK